MSLLHLLELAISYKMYNVQVRELIVLNYLWLDVYYMKMHHETQV